MKDNKFIEIFHNPGKTFVNKEKIEGYRDSMYGLTIIMQSGTEYELYFGSGDIRKSIKEWIKKNL